MKEIWRKIPGFAEIYEVSSAGRVRRLSYWYATQFFGQTVHRRLPAKVFTLGVSPKGYERINLGGKVCAVHRLVAAAFIENKDALPQINHKDGDKRNNSYKNLEWCTNQQNRDHAVAKGLQAGGPRPHMRKHKPHIVKKIVELYLAGKSLRRVASAIKIEHTTVRKILHREGIGLRGKSEAASLR